MAPLDGLDAIHRATQIANFQSSTVGLTDIGSVLRGQSSTNNAANRLLAWANRASITGVNRWM